MREIFTLLYATVIGAAIGLGAAALWATRYDYRIIYFLQGGFYELQHDRWTGRECVSNSNAWERVSYDLRACELNVTRYVPTLP